jgi:hypothetical protein
MQVGFGGLGPATGEPSAAALARLGPFDQVGGSDRLIARGQNLPLTGGPHRRSSVLWRALGQLSFGSVTGAAWYSDLICSPRSGA